MKDTKKIFLNQRIENYPVEMPSYNEMKRIHYIWKYHKGYEVR